MSCIYITKREFQTFYENVLKFRYGHYDGGHMYKYENDEIYNEIVRIQKTHYDGMKEMYGDEPDELIEKKPFREYYCGLDMKQTKKLLKQIHYIWYQSDELDCDDPFLNALAYDLAAKFTYDSDLGWGIEKI